MTCESKPSLAFARPEWSVLKFRPAENSKVYTITNEEEIIAYAWAKPHSTNDFMIEAGFKPVCSLEILETNPEYRFQGHARALVDYISKDTNVIAAIVPGTDAFYSKMGFRVLYWDEGFDGYTLVKMCEVDKSAFLNFIDIISDQDASCTSDEAGAIYDIEEDRYIFADATDEQELTDIEVRPYRINSVKKQTLKLQLLVAKKEPGTLIYVKDIHPRARKMAIACYGVDAFRWLEGKIGIEEYTVGERVLIEEGRIKIAKKREEIAKKREENALYCFQNVLTEIITVPSEFEVYEKKRDTYMKLWSSENQSLVVRELREALQTFSLLTRDSETKAKAVRVIMDFTKASVGVFSNYPNFLKTISDKLTEFQDTKVWTYNEDYNDLVISSA